ncbi:hypothetical protein MKZ38_000065 [Zalerion maritima]|uniref:Uncharacterized protein n=1 Tax=Zalerion maritima TaxID=339359 RepID=A0AAD5RFQ3_9PEZI|nr:hypothetical protein MKZ38_000065 [Zalerion maritima]
MPVVPENEFLTLDVFDVFSDPASTKLIKLQLSSIKGAVRNIAKEFNRIRPSSAIGLDDFLDDAQQSHHNPRRTCQRLVFPQSRVYHSNSPRGGGRNTLAKTTRGALGKLERSLGCTSDRPSKLEAFLANRTVQRPHGRVVRTQTRLSDMVSLISASRAANTTAATAQASAINTPATFPEVVGIMNQTDAITRALPVSTQFFTDFKVAQHPKRPLRIGDLFPAGFGFAGFAAAPGSDV